MQGSQAGAAEARIDIQERVASHQLVGDAEVRRIGWWRFPAHELIGDGHQLALMGRAGWFKIFLGTGQRIELPDGSRWRLRSMAAGGDIVPIIVDSKGRKIALGGASHGAYGINTRDAAFVLFRAGRQRRGRGVWVLRHFDDELAILSRTKVSISGTHSVPLGVVLLSFVLARYGLPSDSAPTMPAFTWA